MKDAADDELREKSKYRFVDFLEVFYQQGIALMGDSDKDKLWAFLTGVLTGMAVVEADKTLNFVENTWHYLIEIGDITKSSLTQSYTCTVNPHKTYTAAKSGLNLLNNPQDGPKLQQLIEVVTAQCPIRDKGRLVELGLGLVLAAYQAKYPQMLDPIRGASVGTTITDADLEELLRPTEPDN